MCNKGLISTSPEKEVNKKKNEGQGGRNNERERNSCGVSNVYKERGGGSGGRGGGGRVHEYLLKL